MKKKSLSFLLAGALVLAGVLFVVFGKTAKTEVHADEVHVHCYCGAEEAHDGHGDQTWTAWTSKTALPTVKDIPEGETAGYFYLTEDVAFAYSWEPGAKVADLEGTELNICLNGHTVTKTSGSRMTTFLSSYVDSKSVQNKNFTLTVTDCQETPGTLLRAAALTNDGGFFWLGANSDASPTNLKLNLYNINMVVDSAVAKNTAQTGGAINAISNAQVKLKNVNIENASAKNGGAIYVGGSATLELDHTTVSNCESSALGGGLYLTGNTYTNLVNGTEIADCKAGTYGGSVVMFTTSNLDMTDAKLVGGYSVKAGGNIQVETGGTINMFDGAVMDGGECASGQNGGNVSMSSATAGNAHFNMYDGSKIINGVAGNISGNIQFCTGNFHMYGGEISGGKNGAKLDENASSSNLHIFGNDCTFIMEGGVIDGRVDVKSCKNLTFKGTAVVNGSDTVRGMTITNTYYGSTTSYAKALNMTFGPFEEGASINIYSTDLAGNKAKVLAGNADATDYLDTFNNTLSNGVDYSVKNYVNSSRMVIGVIDSDKDGLADRLVSYSAAGTAKHCHCVCGGTMVDGETYGVGPGAFVHHCVDVVWTELTVTDGVATRPAASGNYYIPSDCVLAGSASSVYGKTIGICFNGHTATQNSSRVYQTNAVPSGMTATSAAATITLTDCGESGGIKALYTQATNTNQGAMFWTSGSIASTFNVYAGTYDYSEFTMTGNSAAVVNLNAGTFNQYGGTIYGLAKNLGPETGTSASLGGVLLNANSTYNMYGGTFSGGKSATRASGQYAYGGNVFVNASTAKFNMYGGVIENGIANRGGNVYCSAGTTVIYGGVIRDGQAVNGVSATDVYAGNLGIAGNVTVTMNGGTITGGTAAKNGGNVRANGLFIMNGGVIEKGSAPSGGNVFINVGSKDASLAPKTGKGIMNGGIICDGIATTNGANVYTNGTGDYVNGEFTMNGGEITGGNCNGSGGSVFVGGVFNLVDGTISGGYTKQKGANVAIIGSATRTNAPTFNMTGGTLCDGVAEAGSANVYIGSYGVANIDGGVLVGGSHVGGDHSIPNIGNEGGTLKVTGGVMTIDPKNAGSNAIWVGGSALSAEVSGGCIERIWSNANNNLTGFISGGYFTNRPSATLIQEGKAGVLYAPVEKKTAGEREVSFRYMIGEGFVVTLESQAVTGGASIATLSGGNTYAAGTPITIVAPEESKGYTFQGWHLGTATGALVSADPTYEVTAGVSADTTYVAVYAYGSTKIPYTVNASAFTVKVGAAEGESFTVKTTGDADVATAITITYTGTEKFVCWKNTSNKIVSNDAEYTFDIYTATTLTAEVITVAEGETRVIFMSDTEQVLKVLNTSETLVDSDLPAVPARVMTTGGKWDKTLEEINAAITDADTDSIVVKATGYVSTGTVYVPIEEQSVPTIVLNKNIITAQADSKVTLSIGATRNVPAGFKLVEQGILMGNDTHFASADEAMAGLGVGSSKGVAFISNSTEANGITIVNVRNVATGKTLYAKGYMIYVAEGSTEPVVVYTGLAVGTTEGINVQ